MKKTVCMLLVLVLALSCFVTVMAESQASSVQPENGGSILTKLSGLWEKAKAFVNENWKPISAYLKTLWQNAQGLFGDATSSISHLFGGIGGSISELISKASEFINGFSGQIGNLIA